MEKTTFLIELTPAEKVAWAKAAAKFARANGIRTPNISALVRQAMAEKLEREGAR